MSDSWHLADANKQIGPLSFQELKQYLAGISNADRMFVWRPGLPDWTPVADVGELSTTPPPRPLTNIRAEKSRDLSVTRWLMTLCVRGLILFLIGGIFVVVPFLASMASNQQSTQHFVNSAADDEKAHLEAQNAADAEAAINISSPSMPEAEMLLIAAVERSRAVYATAGNEMAQGAARPARAKEICATLKNLFVAGWVGEVEALSSNSDGWGVLSIKIADGISIKTWNNTASDSGNKTLIEPESPVFKQAVVLTKGQRVTFGGLFFRDTTDCIREASLTLKGSLTQPEFIFRFSEVAPAVEQVEAADHTAEMYRAWKSAKESARQTAVRADMAWDKMDAVEKGENVPANTRAAVKAEQDAAFAADSAARDNLRAAEETVPVEAMSVDDLCEFVVSLKTTYENGQTIFHGYQSRGVPILKAIAETGNGQAEWCLGNRYSEVEKDDRRAMELYRRAAEHGYKHAMISLGDADKKAGKCDAAISWFKRASTSKEKTIRIIAKIGLGQMYEGGKDGCYRPPDVIEQYAWYDAAAGRKFRTDKGKDLLAVQLPECRYAGESQQQFTCVAATNRFLVAEKMTEEQIAAARAMTRGR